MLSLPPYPLPAGHEDATQCLGSLLLNSAEKTAKARRTRRGLPIVWVFLAFYFHVCPVSMASHIELGKWREGGFFPLIWELQVSCAAPV